MHGVGYLERDATAVAGACHALAGRSESTHHIQDSLGSMTEAVAVSPGSVVIVSAQRREKSHTTVPTVL